MITKLTDIELIDDAIVGTGAFSKVVRCRLKADNKIYALKIVDMAAIPKEDADNLNVELEIHKSIVHKHIVRLYSSYREGDFYYFLMDYCPGNTLYFYIHVRQGLPEVLALRFLYQTALALEHMHSKGLIHRDIKPENLLIDNDYNIRVCDFGWACRADKRKPRLSIAGTFEYMAPEVVFQQGHDFPSDVWTLGVLLYEMLHGTGPYSADTHEEIKRDFQQTKLQFSRTISKEVQALMHEMLTADPEQRITMKGIVGHQLLNRYRGEFERPINREEHELLQSNNYLNQLSAKRAVVRTVNGVPINEIPNYGKVINAPVPGSEAIPRSKVEADLSRGGFAVENTETAFTASRPVDIAQLSAYTMQQNSRSMHVASNPAEKNYALAPGVKPMIPAAYQQAQPGAPRPSGSVAPGQPSLAPAQQQYGQPSAPPQQYGQSQISAPSQPAGAAPPRQYQPAGGASPQAYPQPQGVTRPPSGMPQQTAPNGAVPRPMNPAGYTPSQPAGTPYAPNATAQRPAGTYTPSAQQPGSAYPAQRPGSSYPVPSQPGSAYPATPYTPAPPAGQNYASAVRPAAPSQPYAQPSAAPAGAKRINLADLKNTADIRQ